MTELGADRVDRADDTRVVGRQEADARHDQQRGVQFPGAVGLGEGVPLGVVALLAHLAVHLVAQFPPAVEVARQLGVLLQGAHGPVRGHPHHHLRVHELAAAAAHLPQPLVRLPPVRPQPVDQRGLDRPDLRLGGQTGVPGQRQRVHDLAVHVQLELLHGLVADAYGGGAGESGQPRHVELRQPPLARQAVHDLQVGRVAGDRAQQPVAPRLGLLLVARGEQRVQGEGGVAQPAVPVVPVAHTAQLLGERGGGGGDDTAGRPVGERLQGDQGADDGVPVRAVVGAAPRPCPPVPDTGAQRLVRVDQGRARLVRGVPGEDERDLLALLDRELRVRAELLAPRAHFGLAAQPDRVRTGDGHPVSVGPAHPRDDRAVVEAQPQIAVHGDPAADALDDAHEVGRPVALGHQVGDADRAVVGLPLGVQHQGVRAVGASGAGTLRVLGGEAPVAVLLVAEEPGEAGGGVEAGQTQPVDGAVRADQGSCLLVADEGVVLDTRMHEVRVP